MEDGRNGSESLSPVERGQRLFNRVFCPVWRIGDHSGSGKSKARSEKWRPRDGLYIRADTEFTGPCEYPAPYLLELGKKRFVVDERRGCKITKIADTAPGALQLDMNCTETDNPDEGDGKNYKEVMRLRKIDDASFYMQLTDKGKANGALARELL